MHHGGAHNANNTIFIQAIGKLINECQMAAGVFFCPILDMPTNKKHSQAFSMYKMTFHFIFETHSMFFCTVLKEVTISIAALSLGHYIYR